MNVQQAPWIDDALGGADGGALIARVTAATALPGRLRKRLDVPAGSVAVVAQEGRPLRVLGAGAHTLGGAAAWYRGDLALTQVAVLPQQVGVAVTAPRIGGARRFVQAGDRQPLDLTFHLAAAVTQPARFFAQLVQPRGRLTQLELAAALSQQLLPTVEGLVGAYDAETAADPAVRGQLQAALDAALPALLAPWGLAPQSVLGLSIRPAADLVRINEHSARLEAALRAQARDAAMSRLQDEAEWRDYVRGLEEAYDLPGLTAAATAPAAASATAATAEPVATPNRLAEALARLRTGRLAGELARGRTTAGRPPVAEAAPEPPSRLIRLLTWLRYALSALALLIVVLDVLAMDRQDPTFGTRVLELLLKIAGVALAGAITFLAQSRAAARRVETRQAAALSLLTGGDLQKADALVRGQVGDDLRQMQEILKDARLRIYEFEHAGAVVAVKKIEQRAERLMERIGRPDYAAPAYLANLVLTPRLLHTLVQQDQAILQASRNLIDESHRLRTEATGGNAIEAQLPALEIALQTFEKEFQDRRRVLAAFDTAALTPLPQS